MFTKIRPSAANYLDKRKFSVALKMLLLVIFALISTYYVRNYSRTQRTATAFCDLKKFATFVGLFLAVLLRYILSGILDDFELALT